MSSLSEKDRKIVRKRVIIFYIVGLSLCFGDISYHYVSWQIKKADLVQVGNSGVYVQPSYQKEREIVTLEKKLQDFEKSVEFNSLKLAESESIIRKFELKKSKTDSEIRAFQRLKMSEDDTRDSIARTKSKIEQINKDLIYLNNKEV